MKKKQILLFLAIAIGLPYTASAQKKELDHSVYDGWKHIDQVQLTPNGKVLSYGILPQEGDGTLIIRFIPSKEEIKIPRGYNAKLSSDCKWAYCLIKPLFAQTRQARIAKKSKENMPQDSLALINLTTKQITKIPKVLSYKTGIENLSYVAFTTPSELKKIEKNKKKDVAKGKSLIICNPANLKQDTIHSVEYYGFNRSGSKLYLTVKPEKKDSVTKPAVILYNLPSLSHQVLSEGKAFYSEPTFDDKGNQLTFLASADTATSGNKHCSLFLYRKGNTQEIIPQNYTRNLPKGWSLNENSNPCFSLSGNRLYAGIAPWRAPKDTSIVDFETAQLDVWGYNDYLTQPMQKKNLDSSLKKTYLSVIDLNNPTSITPLTTSFFDRVVPMNAGDADFALSWDNTKYIRSAQWDSNDWKDVSLVNLKTGVRKDIVTKLNAQIHVSPNGKYLLWYNEDDSQWYTYNVATGKTICLTKNCGVKFCDEEWDQPSPAPSYSSPIWVEDDAAILLCDRYDVWKFNPDGKSAINLTKGEGRKEHCQYRYLNMKINDHDTKYLPRKNFIGKGERIYLTAFDEESKKNGMAILSSITPEKPVAFVDTFTYAGFCKAKEIPVIVYQKGNFSHADNLYLTSDNWKTESCLTDINPQMKNYRWGSAHLVSWKAYDGTPLKGILYIPENIDKNKKYPMMIYFYERRSETLYEYYQPAPSRSIINIPFYCSRGYLVFVPDIVYKIGHPGESAYNCIVSGAEAMCSQFPFADKSNMALQGQSWGGYQTAYLITRTNMFKAAGAGAPVSNMTSAYGGIRWESGISRSWQYEHEQSRIGKSMWEKGALDLYIENSPVFFADKVETPLLIMHNDNDGAVPWYQGIEYYDALRRLDKKVWLLEYNNEQHNLSERRNSKDLSVRLQQFFDHYLKGAPIPAWMKTGVPATRKGEYFGFEY
jgi:dienelactone hydrolase